MSVSDFVCVFICQILSWTLLCFLLCSGNVYFFFFNRWIILKFENILHVQKQTQVNSILCTMSSSWNFCLVFIALTRLPELCLDVAQESARYLGRILCFLLYLSPFQMTKRKDSWTQPDPNGWDFVLLRVSAALTVGHGMPLLNLKQNKAQNTNIRQGRSVTIMSQDKNEITLWPCPKTDKKKSIRSAKMTKLSLCG